MTKRNAIVYCVNGNRKYVDSMVFSINSFYQNNPKWLTKGVKVFVLTRDKNIALPMLCDEADVEIVTEFVGDYSKAKFRNEDEKNRFSEAAFYRWEIFKNPIFWKFDNVLYLDSDTQVKGNLCELFRPCMRPRIRLVSEKMRDWIRQRFKEIGLGEIRNYCNSGIMLVNPKMFSEKELTGMYDALMNETQKRPGRYPDQDAIN